MRALLVMVLWLFAATARAEAPLVDVPGQDEPWPEVELPDPEDPVPTNDDEIDRHAAAIAKTLRCPVCQSTSVDDSPSDGARAMKDRIRELVAEGYSGQQIRDYFVMNYGESMLLAPPAVGIAWVIWLGPGLAAALGLAGLAIVVQRWRREPDDVPLPSDVGLAPKDPYEERLLAELEDE